MWSFFDTLPREHCVFFLIISVFAFAAFIVLFVMAMFAKQKVMFFIMSLAPLVGYYVYLLLYSMCVNSIK